MGDKALAELKTGAHESAVNSAARYPEGTLITFTPATFVTGVVTAVIRAKLARR